MSDAEDPVLEVSHLGKKFRSAGRSGRRFTHEVEAVRDVSFKLARGSALGIVGESGSGKTTIARMLMGLVAPTAGTITLEGNELPDLRDAKARRARARVIQMIFQDPYTSLDPRQRVQDGIDEIQNVHFNRSSAERTARTAQLLESVGLGARHGRAVAGRLSGGQRQRVAIARALASEPRVLVLDEAVSALDVSIQAQILNLLTELRARLELTYIMISHDLAVIRQIADECIVMYKGTVVEQGMVDVILATPEHPYTRRLIDSVPRRGMVLTVRRDMALEQQPAQGCAFCAQCEFVHDRCSGEPELLSVGADHGVRCWLSAPGATGEPGRGLAGSAMSKP